MRVSVKPRRVCDVWYPHYTWWPTRVENTIVWLEWVERCVPSGDSILTMAIYRFSK